MTGFLSSVQPWCFPSFLKKKPFFPSSLWATALPCFFLSLYIKLWNYLQSFSTYFLLTHSRIHCNLRNIIMSQVKLILTGSVGGLFPFLQKEKIYMWLAPQNGTQISLIKLLRGMSTLHSCHLTLSMRRLSL